MRKRTGKAGSFTLATHVINIKKWETKVDRVLADTTDSADYDATSDSLWQTQEESKLGIEVTIEGLLDLDNYSTNLINNLFSGGQSVAAILKFTASDIFGHGNFDLSAFTTSNPVEEGIPYSATLKSNGVFTQGS